MVALPGILYKNTKALTVKKDRRIFNPSFFLEFPWLLGCPGEFMVLRLLYPGAQKGSTGRGSGSKLIGRQGHPTDWESRGLNSLPLGIRG